MTTENLSHIAEVELIYRNQTPYRQRPKIKSPEDAALILRRLWDDNKIELLEQAKLMLLDRNMACLGVSDLATGGVSGCVIDPVIVYATAIKAKASAIILAHNHPSGNLAPSKADRALTDKIIEGGRILGIEMHDHLIMTKDGFSCHSQTWDCYPS